MNIYSVPHTLGLGSQGGRTPSPLLASGTCHFVSSGPRASWRICTGLKLKEIKRSRIYLIWVHHEWVNLKFLICSLELHYSSVISIYLLLCFTFQLPLVSLSHWHISHKESLTVHSKVPALLGVSPLGWYFNSSISVQTRQPWKEAVITMAFKDRIWMPSEQNVTTHSHSWKPFGQCAFLNHDLGM